MLFQMRSMSSVAAFTPVSAGQVLFGASFDYICFFVTFITSGSSGINTKGLFCIVTFSSFVSSAQVTGTFSSLHVITESIKKTGPLSQIILLSAHLFAKFLVHIVIPMPVFITFSLTSSFPKRYLLPFPPLENGSSCWRKRSESVPQPILQFTQFPISSHIVPCSISQMRSPGLHAVEARQMGMSLLASLVLQS